MTPIRCHPYVSHLVRVAPRPAGIGLDFARSCLSGYCSVGTEDERIWGVCTPAGTLRFGGPFARVVPRPRGYRPHRVATGTLHPAGRGLGPVAVTLELLPWSRRWSELALVTGPLRRRDSRSRAERAYLLAAHATLDRLVRAVETPRAEWLARLVTGQPLPLPDLEDVAVVRRPGHRDR
jgi:hypothetical protein